MDRTEFEIRDQGYQEDRQRLLDDKSTQISPPFDQRLQNANASYMERLRVIRNSEYTIEERNRIEQQELETHNANTAAIEAEKEAALDEAIYEDDQKLQELAFGKGGREEAETRMLEYEQTLEREQQAEAKNEAETETENEVEPDQPAVAEAENGDYFNAEDFDYSEDYSENRENYETLSKEFNDTAPAPEAPSADRGGGIEP